MFFAFWGCQDVKFPEKPANLMTEDQMVDVLTEVYLINSARSQDNKTIIQSKVQMDSFVFKKFKIDSLQFALSNAYYSANLDTYNRLFTRVDERLQFLKKRADSILEIILVEEKRVQDSINDKLKDSLGLKKRDTIITKPQLIDPPAIYP
jgi:hypothetical protein